MTVWKVIPGYSNYEASSDGRIRNRSSGLIYKPLHHPDGYVRASVKQDNGVRVRIGVHRLVCLAFHGLPPDKDHRVTNHKDGCKSNNHPSNLEWATYQKNTEHAILNDLVTGTAYIKVKDLETGELYVFKSISAAGRYFNLSHYQVRKQCTVGKNVPYLGRYVFTRTKPPKRRSRIHRSVSAVDLIKGKLYVAESIDQLAILISLPESRIKRSLERGALLKGFYFWLEGDDYSTSLKKLSSEEIQNSVVNYVDEIEYHLYDYVRNVWMGFSTLREVADYLNINRDTLYSSYNRSDSRIIQGHYLHAGSRPERAPELSQDVITISRLFVPYPPIPIKVTHLKTGEVRYLKTRNELRLELGLSCSSFQRALSKGNLPGLTVECIPLPKIELEDERSKYRSFLAESKGSVS